MKKRVNTDAITNDLHGASLFFTPRAATPAPQPENVPPTAEPASAPQIQPTPAITEKTRTPRTESKPARRFMKRHAFDIYYDQYDSLTRLVVHPASRL